MIKNYYANPEFFWLLVLPIAWFLWYLIDYLRNRRLIIRFSYDPQKILKSRISGAFLIWLPKLLQMAGLVLSIFAMARPQTSLETIKRFAEGIDIMLIMDASGSMETQDFVPNRLEVAKEHAGKFIEGRVDDRIGIILFAEDAFSYVPLTLDYEFLKKQIKAISSNIMPKAGTAVGSAIAIGINRMLESKSPSKVMILMTDGASNRGQIDPVMAARLAVDEKIKIYCIGIGKKEFVQQGPFGTSQTVTSDLDEESLKEIAAITGGEFFRSTDEQGLGTIFSRISSMEKTEVMEENQKDISDLYPKFLFWGFLSFAAAFLLILVGLFNPLEE